MNKISIQYTENCPYTNELQEIRLDFAEMNILGQMSPEYRPSGYHCPLFDECPYPERDDTGRCPVYLGSPQEPY